MQPPEFDLPSGEAKCLPSQHCAQATQCARWRVTMKIGMPIADFRILDGFVQGNCPRYLLESRYRRKAPAAPAPRVHESLPGLV